MHKQLIRTVAASHRQLTNYANTEVNGIHRDINARFAELEQILSRQRTACRRLIADGERGKEFPVDAEILCEYPHFALWVHISEIQQLQRALHIYKHERMKHMNQLVLTSFATGKSIPDDAVKRLSINERETLRRLRSLIEYYGKLMVTQFSGIPTFDRLQTIVESADAGGISFPDFQFSARMGRLATMELQPGVTEWTFEDEATMIDRGSGSNESS